IRDRRWSADQLKGSIDALREEVRARHPPMLLIEDRPGRFHYVVVIQADADGVTFHDPAWGPSRRLSTGDLERAWAPSGYWMLRITPSNRRPQRSTSSGAAPAGPQRPIVDA